MWKQSKRSQYLALRGIIKAGKQLLWHVWTGLQPKLNINYYSCINALQEKHKLLKVLEHYAAAYASGVVKTEIWWATSLGGSLFRGY